MTISEALRNFPIFPILVRYSIDGLSISLLNRSISAETRRDDNRLVSKSGGKRSSGEFHDSPSQLHHGDASAYDPNFPLPYSRSRRWIDLQRNRTGDQRQILQPKARTSRSGQLAADASKPGRQ